MRTYQERVLENSQKYLSDKKIQIVATPGSGKTTLGIELIRRLGMPCLILSLSITIRQQWLERIREGFMTEDSRSDEILSNDLRNMRSITAVAYQALYSAMKHYHGELEDDEAEEGEAQERENVDFTGFDIFAAVKSAGIGTICLDEAHHLRSEWWKALEKFMKAQEGLNVIALTATPPYDSTPGQWKRYIDLCGPIDEEIFTPDLLQGFLYDDTDSYQVSDEERQQMIEELKEAGCIYRGEVSLTHRDALQKFLRRRQSPGMRLGCLSGSVILVPEDTKEKLEEFLKKKGCAGTLLPIGSTGYGRL